MKIRNVDFLQISLMAGGGAAPPVRAPVKETMFEEMARKVLVLLSSMLSVYQSMHCRKKREKEAKLKAASQEAGD